MTDGAVIGSCVGLYLALLVAIGVVASRRTRSAKDFFIAGQGLGLAVTVLATMSAAFSGFVFLGGPGFTYARGLSSLWIVLPIGFTPVLLCQVVGAPLRRLAGRHTLYTVPDYFQLRYGSRTVSGLAALAILLGAVAYLAVQVRALAIVARTFLPSEYFGVALALGLLVLVGYSFFGGMKAGVYTDVAQGLLMLVAALALFAYALSASGGWAALTAGIAGDPRFGPEFLEPLGGFGAVTAFGYFFVFGIGVLGQPHMLHKFYMIRDPRRLRWLPLALGLGQSVCLLVWFGVGLAVPALVAAGRLAAPQRPDDAAALFLLESVPSWLAGLAVAAVLGAIMSTADSFLNIGSAALVRDLPRALGRRVDNELALGRMAVLLVALAAAACAALYGDLIAKLGTLAFGTFAAALAPSLAVGLHWRRVGAGAAGASLVTGLALTLGLELSPTAGRLLPAGVLPTQFALVASFTVLAAWTALGGRSPGAAPTTR